MQYSFLANSHELTTVNQVMPTLMAHDGPMPQDRLTLVKHDQPTVSTVHTPLDPCFN
jgi:hypothetical protein